ncbi:MAG TPA: zf-HC2 domain-containing protein [Gemmatimonadales bacterium]|nr:zf-HC2 domain-containing protein [Gemmatimonadales bacterium]
MSHLDEGTLHALLDGELDLHEVKEIQAHIGSCAACGTRLREVKEFHGEADRLVGVLELPSAPSRRTAPAEPVRAAFGDSPVDRRRTPRDGSRVSGPAAEPPPLLLPENPGYQRGGLIRRMRWAALILVTVGAALTTIRMMPRSSDYAFEGELVPARLGDSTSVLSEEEASPAASEDSGGALAATAKSAPAATPPAARTPTPETAQRMARSRPGSPAPASGQARAAPDGADEEAGLPDALAAGAAGAAAGVAAAGEDQDEGRQADTRAEDDAAPASSQRNVRDEAAVALRELDRERQAERAAAATAALDSARRRDAMARQAAAPPAPRTPEQRSGIYLRIGLDEAAKQLGRPVHVIEGMSPLFMGLASGRNSPGADATRPVVRVVYQDSQGRLIFLDQQRIRPGQSTAAPGAEPHWVQGEIALHLSGEVGPDILRNYRGRVR